MKSFQSVLKVFMFNTYKLTIIKVLFLFALSHQ